MPFVLGRCSGRVTVAGLLVIAVAVAWWWISYADVVRYAYLTPPEAAACLIGRSDLCELARALCRGSHPAAVAGYWWGTFWIGVGLASAGLSVGTATGV
ncbi:MAG TPA: hypothetical protein VGC77_04320 [Rhodopseudomonas sp.]|uniref:hypothetical protein n=1 Tax=Rhodopseudomonas sp. TaxID=1078 RepID=UPI002ED93EAA